jgi:hypothetical protein
MAGPPARQICKALAELHAPLRSLTPHGVTSVDALLAALTRRRRHEPLRVLNLQRVQPASTLLTTRTLKALAKALPQLQQLRLANDHNITSAGMAAAVALLPGLTALHIPRMAALLECSLPASKSFLEGIGKLVHLQHLTLPLLCALEAPGAALASCVQLSRLCFCEQQFQTAAAFASMRRLAKIAESLPALVALEVDADVASEWEFAEIWTAGAQSELQGLSKLVELRLAGVAPDEDCATHQLLWLVAALTSLRRLQLHVEHVGRTRHGWLTRLGLLTSLDVCFCLATREVLDDSDEYDQWLNQAKQDGVDAMWLGEHEADGAFDEVVASVPHLRALRELRIANDPTDRALGYNEFTPGAFSRLASARTTLALLHLHRIRLPHNAMGTISKLTALTSLRVDHCWASGRGCGGLAAMTNLRDLGLRDTVLHSPAGVLVADLTRLETLLLRDGMVEAGDLAMLCGSLPRLKVLDVSCEGGWQDAGTAVAAGASALQQLSELQILDLSHALGTADLGHVKAPPSLRHCYLAHLTSPGAQEEARGVLGAHVDVRFHPWQVPGKAPHSRVL